MNSENSPNSPNYKKRTPPWFLGAFVFVLLLLLVLLQSSNLWKQLEVQSASDTLLLYALSSLNFFAFVVFGFIFVRSLVKLSRERRAFQLGSKIKTKLLMYFFAISLMPIIAMAVFSYLFMNRALERWFSQIPENVVRAPLRVQNQSIEEQSLKLQETANMLATALEKQDYNERDLQGITQAGNLTHLAILSKSGQILISSEKNLDAAQKAELDKTLTFVHKNRLNEQILSDGRDFDVAAAPLSGGRMLIVVPDFRPAENVSQMVDNSLVEFEKLKQEQVTVRQIGLLTLGVLTFMLIFASSWTAFYIARGLTVPIKALAEGADEIARGNLSHRVDVLAEDELALLVSTFNQMSAKLEENSAELRERRKYIETVLQSLPTGVVSFDHENRVTTINKAAVQMLRLESADFTGFDLKQLVNEENRQILERLLARARRIGQASEQTVLRREFIDRSHEIGVDLPVALSATTLPKKTNDQSSGAVLVIEDLSELITAQRASAWQEVARRMAHEIKNPLTPIQLSAERIAKNFYRNASFVLRPSPAADSADGSNSNGEGQMTNDKEQLTKVIDESTTTILREVNSLKSMVDEFSRFARLPNAKLESGDLNEIVNQAIAHYEDRFSDVEIVLNLSENLPAVLLDAEQMRGVFVNLIENSIEAFDKSQSAKQIFIKTFHDAARDLIVAEVADTGGGISPADFQKLFQPYFSTKGRGTGLGLAIVQRIVGEHRGRIKAVLNNPTGAKFIIEIPVAQ
ncbi:MAG: ATP-binding protein [Acidobacteriota bacterium]|nr:ATP-binding protein [Acidobacteriota bacterium]